jgi:UDP-glucose 4-epimerase
MNKVIVFGGSGFLGSHVSDSLSEMGYEVIIFYIIKSAYLRSDQKMIIGNILDRDRVREVVKGADYVYHFAAIADIGEARNNPVESANFNIIGNIYENPNLCSNE